VKKFIISPGPYNKVDQRFPPVTIKAKTWLRAVNKALAKKSIPKDAYSIQILEVNESDEDNEEEESLLALHFREWREDRIIEKYVGDFEGWMI
jgi:hypothetical protein